MVVVLSVINNYGEIRYLLLFNVNGSLFNSSRGVIFFFDVFGDFNSSRLIRKTVSVCVSALRFRVIISLL